MAQLDKQTHSPSTISINFYRNILTNWIQHKFPQKTFSHSLLQYFHNQFLPTIQKSSSLPILFDKRAYLALLELQRSPKYYNICRNSGGKIGDKCWMIVQITEVLYKNSFITSGMRQHVMELGKPQNSVQSKIDRLIEKVRVMKNDQIQELEKLWNQQFCQFRLQFVWENLIYPNLSKLNKKLVQQIYFWYAPLLSLNYPSLYTTLQFTLQPENMPKQSLLRYLLHQHKPQNCQQYFQARQLQLDKLYTFIEKIIKQKYPTMQVRIELFGSARSGFGLQDCDYDISLFCLGSNKQHIDRGDELLGLLHDGFTLNNRYRAKAEKISAAKVPVLKLQLNNKIVINVDIVLNNMHGVENSRYLAEYSQNPSIKQFVLLIKIWAKKYQLVHFQKLSSYGVTFMALYFLMRNGNIGKSTKYQVNKRSNLSSQLSSYQAKKMKIKARPQLLKSINLYEDFNNFLNFYSKNGEHIQSNQCICLLEQNNRRVQQNTKNCEVIHKKIERHYFVFNMHDPFNDTNPGRLNKNNSDQFFNAINKSQKVLSSSHKQIIRQFAIPTENNEKIKL